MKYDVRANLDKRHEQVQAMFDHVAPRYDVMNELMSFGQLGQWRRNTLAALAPEPGEKILDLAAGTGTSSMPLADAGARVVCCDLSEGMLAEGRRRYPALNFIAGDALQLPFPDDTFDAVTISYGLRNIAPTLDALQELRRVTRPGGRMVVAEFSTPTWAPFRVIYRDYLVAAIPALARLASSNPVAYEYLAESITAWPDQAALAEVMAAAGWRRIEWRNLTGGIVALHRAWN